MKVHPAAEIFPMMQEDELRRLADDIQKNRQYEPITVKDGQILDGRNRAAACDMLGVVVDEKEWDGVAGQEFEFVFSKNINRRHLNESQRALAAALAAPMVKGKGIHLGGGTVVNLPPARRKKTAEMLGALFGVSEKTVRYAIAISDSPVLRDAVQSGRFKVSAVSHLAKLSPAEQRQRLDELDKAKVRTPAVTAEKDDSPPVPNRVVDLTAPETDLSRPNLASDATVVIKADSSEIGAAAALLRKWKVQITDVWCAQGEFEPRTVLLIGGRLPEDESAFSHTLAAMITALASPKPMEARTDPRFGRGPGVATTSSPASEAPQAPATTHQEAPAAMEA
jgi:hypothetical protein